jgi:hypothetical protein
MIRHGQESRTQWETCFLVKDTKYFGVVGKLKMRMRTGCFASIRIEADNDLMRDSGSHQQSRSVAKMREIAYDTRHDAERPLLVGTYTTTYYLLHSVLKPSSVAVASSLCSGYITVLYRTGDAFVVVNQGP